MRLANPLVRAILRSGGHRLLSGSLLVLSYRGHRSGRTFEIPLRYVERTDRRLVVVAVRPGRKLWWRSFARSAPADVALRGKRVTVLGSLVEDEARDDALAAYVARYPSSGRVIRDAAVVVLDPTR